MATPVELPKSGNTVEECVIGRWVKPAGDAVSPGDVLAEVETDKATFEITAPVGGTLLATFFPEGALVPVFTTVCVIGEPGEAWEMFRPVTGSAASPQPLAPTAQASLTASPEPQAPTPMMSVTASPQRPAPRLRSHTIESSFRLRASASAGQVGEAGSAAPWSPRARRFAAEWGLEPAGIIGSGPGGRVLEQDVRTAYESAHAAAATTATSARPLASRDVTAHQRRESPAVTGQYTLHASADARQLLAMRARAKETARTVGAPNISINALVTFCTIRALLDTVDLNAELIDGAVVRHRAIHIGFACDTSHGLLVPVVRDAQELSIAALARRMNELAASALDGTISLGALSGGTFTISNLGDIGVEWLTPVVNPPQVAILGVGAIHVKPVRTGGGVDFIDAIALSITCDHQAIDGAQGARFLRTLAEKIEHVEYDLILRS
jgi:pyruvate dehydrogenase E2 component (dihydrolipoyllysine-residue acetyltransferase)